MNFEKAKFKELKIRVNILNLAESKKIKKAFYIIN